jgi:hypothetical protein
MEKVPTESQGAEALIIHSVQAPSAEADVARASRQQSVITMMQDERPIIRYSLLLPVNPSRTKPIPLLIRFFLGVEQPIGRCPEIPGLNTASSASTR